MWDDPGFRIETEVDRVLILHFLETRCQITLLCDLVHGGKVIDFLEAFELAQLLRLDSHIVPNYIDICMAIRFILFGLVGLGDIIMIMFGTGVFLISFLIVSMVLSAIILFLSRDNFPFHLEGALTEHLVLGVGQVDTNLAPIENIVISGRRPHSIAICVCRLFDDVGGGCGCGVIWCGTSSSRSRSCSNGGGVSSSDSDSGRIVVGWGCLSGCRG